MNLRRLKMETGTASSAILERRERFEAPRVGFSGGLLTAVMQLGLSDAQEHEAAIVLERCREDGWSNLENLQEALDALRDALYGNGSDEAEVRLAFRAVADAGEEMALFVARTAKELKRILTPAQLEMLEARKRQMHQKSHSRTAFMRSLVDEWIDVHK
jgi:hypothetical protein